MFDLFFDTDCDITKELADSYGAKLISMPYTTSEGKEYFPYEDWEKFNDKEFYDELRKGKLATTSTLSIEKYKGYFEPSFKEGKDVLYVHFSAAMSGTFNVMRLALEELNKKYPDRKVFTIDTKAITILSYIQCRVIGEMYKAGKSLEEIIKVGNENVQKYAVYFYADNLKFFAKSGRVTGVSAVMGTLIGIKPLIYMNEEGKMVSFSKAIGRKKAIDVLLAKVEELQDHIEDYEVVVGHADALDLAKGVADQLQARFNNKLNIIFTEVNPTAGAHCGPDTLGIAFHAIHR